MFDEPLSKLPLLSIPGSMFTWACSKYREVGESGFPLFLAWPIDALQPQSRLSFYNFTIAAAQNPRKSLSAVSPSSPPTRPMLRPTECRRFATNSNKISDFFFLSFWPSGPLSPRLCIPAYAALPRGTSRCTVNRGLTNVGLGRFRWGTVPHHRGLGAVAASIRPTSSL